MAEQMNQESLSAPLLNVDGGLTDIRTQIIVAPIPPKYSLPTVVLVMEASQYFFALLSTLILSIFGNGLIPILWPIYWIPLIAGLIYIGCYIYVWCMNSRLRDSSFSVFLMSFVILSELVLLSYLSMVWKPFLVCTILAIFMISVYMSAGYAQCMHSRFSAPGARLVALFTIICSFVIFAIFLNRDMLIALVLDI
ncbi:unnamed protein product [Blepharisma stoltei]|uniref:Uncharacterized protein n=1 Tax=Blepharisma stoltei TaxID=1481888 RepID=A0AAU9ILS4_9CILI|nr:unnamed protein product [Blepharisma stoltei]